MDGLRVAVAPERPLAIFDGDCGFCRLWIGRWKSLTGQKVDYAPSQEVGARFPEISAETFRRAMVLVRPDGSVLVGAAAVFGALAEAGRGGLLLRAYRRVPGFAAVANAAYRAIAAHRDAAMFVTRLLWGRSVERPTYRLAAAAFLRLLGLCYVAAFVSLWVQVDGLVGSNGIIPIARFLDWARTQTGAERYWILPTLCWFSSSDAMLHFLCAAGTLSGGLLVFGLAPAASAAAAWLFYLSLSVAGQVFLEFQWDFLLLETGLLAIFLAPPARLRLKSGVAPSGASLFLLRWLLFRLMFSSGWVKLASGDPTWRSLTALRHHYETQPLPPWTAWYLHRMPPSFQTVSTVFMFGVELVVPFLFFAPRRLRLLACGLTVFLQMVIAATGNYAFFNLLTIALAVLLIDDQSLSQRMRERLRVPEAGGRGRSWPRAILAPVAALLFVVSSVHFASTLFRFSSLPWPLEPAVRWISPLRSTNGYGLFAVMTTSRPEIVVEGSDDGQTWRPYEFRWKPGDPMRRPRFVAPHQPRLDWQMWFAALGGYEENPWLVAFLQKLLEGSPQVIGLLARDPFAGHPPRYIRALLYDYRFTDAAARRQTGAWWQRELKGLYAPVLERPSG